jgi:hypothetical protein
VGLRRVLLVCSVLSTAPASCSAGDDAARVVFETPEGRYAVTAELADTPAERARGLMHRSALPDDRGMLFLFDVEGTQRFYMLNTLIPLDLVSIRDGRVVAIQRMEPCDEPVTCTEPLTTTPVIDAAVEVGAGTAAREGIAVGTLVSSDALP